MHPNLFGRSRKSALATRSGLDWQGPEGGVGASFASEKHNPGASKRLLVIPGHRKAMNPESGAITSRFRVRANARPGMTV
jgi:hypothetical protein